MIFQIPGIDEMRDAFGVLPSDCSPSEGYYLYEFADDLGVKLELSFHQQEASVQIVLYVNGAKIALISQEGAVQLKVGEGNDGAELYGLFVANNVRSELNIMIKPHILVVWPALVDLS